jgi:uncharacterized protein
MQAINEDPPLDGAACAARLEETVAQLKSVVVAYSGGVDSAVLLMAAHRALGKNAVGLLAQSPSYPAWEYQEAVDQAAAMGAELVVARTHELEDPRYAENASNRCYFCKSALFDACRRIPDARGFHAIAYGANLDDLADDRPGHQAARERGIHAPLITARLTKAAVRAAAAHYALASARKPALACLSSRFPHGTAIDADKLRRVGLAEHALLTLGFQRVRVRFHGDLARIELDAGELPRLLDPGVRQAAIDGVGAAGFAHVTLDLAGYQMGGANKPANARLPLLS